LNVAVCYNLAPATLPRGVAVDRLAEEGAEREAHAVATALVELGHTATLVALGDDLFDFVTRLRQLAPEVVFNLCEGHWGDSRREMNVAALFELLGLPFTGASPLTLGLTQDKVRTKDLLARHQLPTPRYLLVKRGDHWPRTRQLGYPLIVKPRFEDASQGITNDSIVDNERALLRRIDYVHRTYHQGALVEEYIAGQEINAALIGNGETVVVLPLAEIRFDQDLPRPIVSFEAKWLEDSSAYRGTVAVCPAVLKKREEILIRDLAMRAGKLLECRDYARVDIRLRDGIPYILEINANPDISPDAGLARSAKAAGISYPQLLGRILEMARKRKEETSCAR